MEPLRGGSIFKSLVVRSEVRASEIFSEISYEISWFWWFFKDSEDQKFLWQKTKRTTSNLPCRSPTPNLHWLHFRSRNRDHRSTIRARHKPKRGGMHVLLGRPQTCAVHRLKPNFGPSGKQISSVASQEILFLRWTVGQRSRHIFWCFRQIRFRSRNISGEFSTVVVTSKTRRWPKMISIRMVALPVLFSFVEFSSGDQGPLAPRERHQGYFTQESLPRFFLELIAHKIVFTYSAPSTPPQAENFGFLEIEHFTMKLLKISASGGIGRWRKPSWTKNFRS